MSPTKLNSVTLALVLIAVGLMLGLERSSIKVPKRASLESQERVRQQAAGTLSPVRTFSVDTEQVARFKARVSNLSKRPDLDDSAETGDKPEWKELTAAIYAKLPALDFDAQYELNNLFTNIWVGARIAKSPTPLRAFSFYQREGSGSIIDY